MKQFSVKEFLVIVLLSCTPLLWFDSTTTVMGHDSGFRFNGVRHIQELFYSWQPSINTGADWTLYKGFIITQLPEAIATAMTGSLQSAQPSVFVFWMLLMSAGMYCLLLVIFPDKKFWLIRVTGTTFYVYNFFILQAWFIAERAKFSLYAALPLAFLLLLLMNTKRLSTMKGSIYFGLLYFLLNGGGSPPLFGSHLMLWGFSFLFFSLQQYIHDHVSGLRHVVIVYSVSFFWFGILNAYWILPQVDLYRSHYSSAVSNEGGVDGLIAWEREVSKETSYTNLFRFQGISDWYDNPVHAYSHAYRTNPLLIVGSFIPILIFLVAVRRKNFLPESELAKNTIIFSVVLFVISLPLVAGSHPPLGTIYILFMRYVPGFAIFRSSYYKFVPLLFFSASIFVSYSVSLLLHGQQLKKKKEYIVGGFFILLLLVYHFPYFSSAFFRFSPMFSTKLVIPSYVEHVGRRLDELVDPSARVLLLPPLDDGFINRPIDTYDWGYYSLDVLPRIASSRRILANDSHYPVVHALYDAIRDQRINDINRLASVLHVTHILFRHDILQSENGKTKVYPAATHSFLQTVYGSPVLKEDKWEVFSITPRQFSDVSAFRNVQNANGLGVIPLASEKYPTISGGVDRQSDIVGSESIEAECFWCAENEYDSYTASITLPPQPSRLKRFFLSFREKAVDNTIDGSLSHSLNLLSDAVFEKQQNSGNSPELEPILNEITRAYAQVQSLTGRSQLYYASRLHAFVSKEEEIIRATFSQTTETQDTIARIKEELQNLMWVSDINHYRLGVTVPAQGEYTLKVYPTSQKSILLGNQNIFPDQPVVLTEGFHRIEIEKESTKPPIVLFSKSVNANVTDQEDAPSVILLDKSSVHYTFNIESAELPYVLSLNQSFDSRWKLFASNSRVPISEESHRIHNGYGNAWIMPIGSHGTYTIRFVPQVQFYNGLIVSGLGICCSFIFLIFHTRRREKK